MAALPIVNWQVVDPAGNVRNVCLGTPVILREILQQLPNSQLIKLLLVNKNWNYEARSVLKDRGNLCAFIYTEKHSGCEDLETFASGLSQMRVVPFDGINLVVYHKSGTCQSTPKGSLDPSYSSILDRQRFPFKNFSVEFISENDWDEDCPAVALVKKILKDYGGILEKLSMESDFDLKFHHLFAAQNFSFPRLKTLKIVPESGDEDEDFTIFVKQMVSCSPNLKELKLLYLNLGTNLLEGSSAVLVPCSFSFNPMYDPVGESIVNVLRPERMVFQRRRNEDFDPELLHSLIPRVLEASRITLKTLRMDSTLLLPLRCYGIYLENVTKLEIHVENDNSESHKKILLWTAKLFDFTRVFPKLTNNVEIIYDLERSVSIDEMGPLFVQQWSRMALRPGLKILSDRVANIKHLVLRGSALDSVAVVPFWGEIFPGVTTLSLFLKPGSIQVPTMNFLRDHFKYLMEVKVEHTGSPQPVGN